MGSCLLSVTQRVRAHLGFELGTVTLAPFLTAPIQGKRGTSKRGRIGAFGTPTFQLLWGFCGWWGKHHEYS